MRSTLAPSQTQTAATASVRARPSRLFQVGEHTPAGPHGRLNPGRGGLHQNALGRHPPPHGGGRRVRPRADQRRPAACREGGVPHHVGGLVLTADAHAATARRMAGTSAPSGPASTSAAPAAAAAAA